MKKSLLILLGLAVALTIAPANAMALARKNVTFEATIPCGIACSYQVDQRSNEQFVVEETAGTPVADPYGDSPLAGFSKNTPQACSAPAPEGSYDDIVVKAPRGAKTLVFEIFPSVDWDSFICAKPSSGNNGKQLASGANAVDPDCTSSCKEVVALRVTAGKSYVLRAYNFSDPDPLPARYTFHS